MRIPKFLQVAALILLAAGAQPATSAVWQWSHTASNNATADATINWAEGMSPSSVNDSARAMMARLADYRDDVSGLLVTGGTSSAYTVTSNQGLCPSATVPVDGQLISATVNAVNADSPTLQVDGCTAAPIQSSSAIPVPAGTLLNGTPYNFKYSVANTAWMLKGFYGSALTVPLGGMIDYTLTTVPNSNFVFPAGQCLSTTTYAAYWNALGNPSSGTCAGGMFRIIDMSGRVAAGLDAMPGFAAVNRLTTAAAGCGTDMTVIGRVCANGFESQTLTLAQLPAGITAAGVNTISVSSSTNVIQNGTAGSSSGGGTQRTVDIATSIFGLLASSGSNNVSVVSNNTGGGAHPNIGPTIALTKLLRVL